MRWQHWILSKHPGQSRPVAMLLQLCRRSPCRRCKPCSTDLWTRTVLAVGLAALRACLRNWAYFDPLLLMGDNGDPWTAPPRRAEQGKEDSIWRNSRSKRVDVAANAHDFGILCRDAGDG